jgi:hypothetical protein
LKHSFGLAFLRVRGIERVRLHAIWSCARDSRKLSVALAARPSLLNAAQ